MALIKSNSGQAFAIACCQDLLYFAEVKHGVDQKELRAGICYCLMFYGYHGAAAISC